MNHSQKEVGWLDLLSNSRCSVEAYVIALNKINIKPEKKNLFTMPNI